MKPGDLVKYRPVYSGGDIKELLPDFGLFGLVITWTKKHQYQVELLMNTGETEWEYISELEVISEAR
jgi:hypothetical protein